MATSARLSPREEVLALSRQVCVWIAGGLTQARHVVGIYRGFMLGCAAWDDCQVGASPIWRRDHLLGGHT